MSAHWIYLRDHQVQRQGLVHSRNIYIKRPILLVLEMVIRLKEAAETRLTISMTDVNAPKINVSQSTHSHHCLLHSKANAVQRLPGDQEIRTCRTSWLLLMDSANKCLLPDKASSWRNVCPEETQYPHRGTQILIQGHNTLIEGLRSSQRDSDPHRGRSIVRREIQHPNKGTQIFMERSLSWGDSVSS